MFSRFIDILIKTILCIVFLLFLTPAGLLLRLFGKDYLCRRFEKSATTYWSCRA